MEAKCFAAPGIIETPDNQGAEKVGEFYNIGGGVVARLFKAYFLFRQRRRWLVGKFGSRRVEECAFIGHGLKRFSGLRTRRLVQQGGESIVGETLREFNTCDLAGEVFIGLAASCGGNNNIGNLPNADLRSCQGRCLSQAEKENGYEAFHLQSPEVEP